MSQAKRSEETVFCFVQVAVVNPDMMAVAQGNRIIGAHVGDGEVADDDVMGTICS